VNKLETHSSEIALTGYFQVLLRTTLTSLSRHFVSAFIVEKLKFKYTFLGRLHVFLSLGLSRILMGLKSSDIFSMNFAMVNLECQLDWPKKQLRDWYSTFPGVLMRAFPERIN
jgi:hypothetical protein